MPRRATRSRSSRDICGTARDGCRSVSAPITRGRSAICPPPDRLRSVSVVAGRGRGRARVAPRPDVSVTSSRAGSGVWVSLRAVARRRLVRRPLPGVPRMPTHAPRHPCAAWTPGDANRLHVARSLRDGRGVAGGGMQRDELLTVDQVLDELAVARRTFTRWRDLAERAALWLRARVDDIA
jgi:hypothetical protein